MINEISLAILSACAATAVVLVALFFVHRAMYTEWSTAFMLHDVEIIHRYNMMTGELQLKMRMKGDKVV